MRRALRKDAIVLGGESAVRASVSEALFFDLRSAETPDDESLASQRVAAFDHAALLMAATHLICGVASFALNDEAVALVSVSGALIFLGLAIGLDCVAAVVR